MRWPVSMPILCASVNGLPNKIDELHVRIEDYEPYVLLTECFPKAQVRELAHSYFTVGEYYTPISILTMSRQVWERLVNRE